MDDAFDYLLELSMAMPVCDTDRDALREAHAALSTLSSECGVPSTVVQSLVRDAR